jgi:hypothetical protein
MTIKYLFPYLFLAGLVACGGGGGGSGSSASSETPVIQKTYVSSATAGEVLKYSVDTVAKTYSYEILQSAYNLAGKKGNGTLSYNGDGTYSPSESPKSKIIPLKNGLLLGNVNLAMNGNTSQDVPIIGMENPATTADGVAGTYNFVSLQCNSKSYGIYSLCGTAYGTVKVTKSTDTTASFTSCTNGDIDNNCTGNTTTGTLEYYSNGVWKVKASNSIYFNYLVAFTSPNGQKVGWIDFNDPTVFKYGQAVISQKQRISSGSGIDGRYFAMNTYGQSGELSLSTNTANFQITATTASGSINTATGNQPWDGFAKTPSGDGYGLMAGNGVYAYIKPNSYYLEIGVQK